MPKANTSRAAALSQVHVIFSHLNAINAQIREGKMVTFVMFYTFCVQTRAREDGHIWHVLHFLCANKGKGRWKYLACFALFVCKQGRGKMAIFGMFCTFCVQTRAREDGHIWHVLHFLPTNKGRENNNFWQ